MKITFYKISSNHKNEPYHARMMSFIYPSSITKQEAVLQAIKEFQEKANVSHWQEAADFYEVE